MAAPPPEADAGSRSRYLVGAAFLLPTFVLLGVWKHGAHRVPIRYTPVLWGMVFPLGMYALATLRLSLAADVPALRALSVIMAWIALAAWTAIAIGLALASWRSYWDFAGASS